MTTLLITHAHIFTMNDHQREIPDGGRFVRDDFMEQVGATSELPQTADEGRDLTGHLVLPGINAGSILTSKTRRNSPHLPCIEQV